MDLKKNLRTYMMNFPESFVGFLDCVADILYDLGTEWHEHGNINSDKIAKEWALGFDACANSIRDVSEKLAALRKAYETHNAEPQTPSDLINIFKNKILKDIKR